MRKYRRLGILGGLIAAVILSLPALASHDAHVVPAPLPPLPATAEIDPAVQADLSAKGYHVSEIRDDVYWITDGNYHSMFVVADTGVVLVDAPEPLPFFPPIPVLDAIAEVTDKPVTHMIYSHGHTDHIGGAGAVKEAFPGVQIIAHKETRAILERANDPRRPVPTATFNKQRNLNVGGKLLQLSYFGNTHQEGNTFIYLPGSKILMVVDIVYPGWVPFRRLALSNDVAGWYSGHDAVLSFDFDTLVGGHLTRLGNRDDAVLGKEYVDDIRTAIEGVYLDATALFAAVGAINAEHDPGNLFGGFFAFQTVAKWALFSAFYDFSTQHCADLLDAKWNGVLGGGETFNFSNCEAWFVARRLGTDR